ncbi:MAG: bacterioferritin [Actinobacteria bacterium]|nr:bacterioferritin [Actinomycetota bacterium]MBV9663585.1 bacterioferritin [Actinomycetota bacterium]MBV9935793.1 bacterioferritin [Actinomycetota bacterium]
MSEFLSDVQSLRDRARQQIEMGPITDAYGADRDRVITVLNEVLATELVCYLRYKRHYFTASGINAQSAAAEFLQHATEELGHADLAATRITQLQGDPDFNPDVLSRRSHAEYTEGKSLIEMVKDDLVAERVAIASYQEIVRWLGNDDPTTRNMIETILATEEEHANDMLDLLKDLS